jgi:hypothetical protein
VKEDSITPNASVMALKWWELCTVMSGENKKNGEITDAVRPAQSKIRAEPISLFPAVQQGS